jgi:DNA-binding transcriptional LysR family regulator
MQLRGIDTNLFVVLSALLEEQHVGRAGKRLGLSPSATSHALSRLREVIGDPLFVRAGRRLVPTARATALTPVVKQAIDALEAVVAPPAEIEPRRISRAFRVETTDHLQFVLMRHLDPLVRAQAPRVDVFFQSLQPSTYERLRAGAIDLSIGVYSALDADIDRARLFDDRLVAVVRSRHPALRKRVTLARFAALDHLLVAPNGTPTGLVDRLLAEHALERRVARTSSTFLDMAFLVAETDYVVSLPEKMIRPMLGALGLAILPVPMLLPSFTISMVWHKRHAMDGAHRWFREVVHEAANQTGGRAR